MLSIILPAYREKDNLALLIPRITRELGARSFEIIVVDDDSGDGTEELISASKDKRVRLLKRAVQRQL